MNERKWLLATRSEDAASLAGPSGLDQLHMDAKNHGALAEGIAEMVKGYFEP